MNVKRDILIITTCLSLSAIPQVEAGEIYTLVDAPFNTSTTRIGLYPPDPGVRFVELASGFSAWAVGGQIRLTQGMGYGTAGTSGIFAEITKKTDAKFYQISFQKLPFTMLRPGLVIRDPIRSLRFSIDAKIPTGRDILVYVSIDPPKDMMPQTPWGTRLVLGTLKGTDAYESYMLNGTDVHDETVNVFINYIRDLQLNGMEEAMGSLVLHMHPEVWEEGDGLLFDNVKLQVSTN